MSDRARETNEKVWEFKGTLSFAVRHFECSAKDNTIAYYARKGGEKKGTIRVAKGSAKDPGGATPGIVSVNVTDSDPPNRIFHLKSVNSSESADGIQKVLRVFGPQVEQAAAPAQPDTQAAPQRKKKFSESVVVISYPGDIAGFDADKLKMQVCKILDGLTPDMVQLEECPEDEEHRRPKKKNILMKLKDSEEMPIEVHVNEQKMISLSQSEGSTSDATDSELDLKGDTHALLPTHLKKGFANKVSKDDINIIWYKSGSVTICLRLPAVAAVKLKLATSRRELLLDMAGLDFHLCGAGKGESQTIKQETIQTRVVDKSTGAAINPIARFGEQQVEQAVRSILGDDFSAHGVYLSYWKQCLLIRVSPSPVFG